MADDEARVQKLEELVRQLCEAQRAERRELAEIVHDGLGTSLTALKFQLALLSDLPEEIGESIQEQAGRALETTKRLGRRLREAMVDKLGFVAALEQEVGEVARRLGVRFDLELPNEDPRLEPELAQVLFQVARGVLHHFETAGIERLGVAFEHTGAGYELELRGRSSSSPLEPLTQLLYEVRLEPFGGRLEWSVSEGVLVVRVVAT